MDKLHAMAGALIKYETIDENQIKDIMNGREPKPPEGWDSDGEPPVGALPDESTEPAIGGPASQH